MPTRWVRLAAMFALTAAVTPLAPGAASAAGRPATAGTVTSVGGAGPAAVRVRIDPSTGHGGRVPDHFVGFSVEWSLIERYMGPDARGTFATLLGNLGTGILRVGGSSQDVMPFDPAAPNTNQVITPEDLRDIRATLDRIDARDRPGARPSWGVVLGTAMSPPGPSRPFVSPDHAHTFVTKGVQPVFAGAAARDVAGVELGNEPDLSYGSGGLDRYLGDLATYSGDAVTGPMPVIAPNTSEDILPWQSIDRHTVPTRYFWDWPRILDTGASRMTARAGAFGAWAADHFYPLARTCPNKPYRCPSTAALLSDEHMASLDYQVYAHAQEAARHGLGYRLEETNTAANRGADGVSNVAASATYALDLMFHTACPQPPNAPSANTGCGVGALGLNFHNAEVRAFFHPEEGNAYYNAIDYDPTPAMGAPAPAPLYYAVLLFARFAQGAHGLRPVSMSADGGAVSGVQAWQVDGHAAQRRLFLINKNDHPVTVAVTVPARTALVDRMTPYDPTGAGRTLDAPQVRVDGRQVAADGSWPGFRPETVPVKGRAMTVTLGAGEACVITVHTGR